MDYRQVNQFLDSVRVVTIRGSSGKSSTSFNGPSSVLEGKGMGERVRLQQMRSLPGQIMAQPLPDARED